MGMSKRKFLANLRNRTGMSTKMKILHEGLNMTPEQYKKHREEKLKAMDEKMEVSTNPKVKASLKEKHDALVAGKTIQK